ncbi:CHAP domain-containing protein [Micromonospora sp. CPCC 205371]|nr:CHAP domain-containing protein [Micromonospora sp. CPCC 205371]
MTFLNNARKAIGLTLGLIAVGAALVVSIASANAATSGRQLSFCTSSATDGDYVVATGTRSNGAWKSSKKVKLKKKLLCMNLKSVRYKYDVTVKWYEKSGKLRRTTTCWVPPANGSAPFSCWEKNRVNKNPNSTYQDCAGLSLRERIACVAWSQRGVIEVNNSGANELPGVSSRSAGDKWHCAKYFKSFGSNLNCESDSKGHWCAAFTRWVWTKAGVKSVPKSFHAGTWRSKLKKHKTGSPRVGDYAVWNDTHSGIVVRRNGDRIGVIEGNASDAARYRTYTLGGAGAPTDFYQPPNA